MSQIIQFCARLESRLDQCLFAAPDDQDSGLVKGAAIGVGGGGVVGGGYLGHQAVMDKYSRPKYKNRGLREAMPAPTVSQAYKAAGTDLYNGASAMKDAASTAGREAYQGLRAEGRGMLRSGAGGLSEGVRAMLAKLRR